MTDTEFETETLWCLDASTRLAKLEASRPTQWSVLRLALTSGVKGPNPDEVIAQWDAAHPEAVELRAELKRRKHELDLERYARDAPKREAAAAAYQKREEERAMASLRDVPRVAERVREGLDEDEVTKTVDEFAQVGCWCLLLLGGVGCGKSTGAGRFVYNWTLVHPEVAVVNPLPRPVWVRASEASRLSGFGEETEKRLHAMRTTAVLVLDDLGNEIITPTWQQTLDDVLDDRYQHRRQTIITANVTGEVFKQRYGERIADRIREDGMIKTITAASRRKRPT